MAAEYQRKMQEAQQQQSQLSEKQQTMKKEATEVATFLLG